MVFAFLPPEQKVLMIPDLKISPGLQQMIDLNRGPGQSSGLPSAEHSVLCMSWQSAGQMDFLLRLINAGTNITGIAGF